MAGAIWIIDLFLIVWTTQVSFFCLLCLCFFVLFVAFAGDYFTICAAE
jgi:hypothetical protein